MSKIVPFKKPAPKERVCAFCKTPESKAKKFVAGQTHNICGRCIEQCKKRLDEDNALFDPRPKLSESDNPANIVINSEEPNK